MSEFDKWALLRLEEVDQKVTDAYENYEFHMLYHAIHNFCTVDLSSIYLDVMKDTMYAESKNDVARRSAQTAMYEIRRNACGYGGTGAFFYSGRSMEIHAERRRYA